MANEDEIDPPEEKAPAVPSIREALESAIAGDASETVENDSETVSRETAPAADDRPRGPDGKFIAKDAVEQNPPAAKGAAEAPTPAPTLPAATPSAPEIPQHWSQADRDMLAKQAPEARAWLLGRHKAMEADYTRKSQASAELNKALEPHADYIRAVGATPAQAFSVLITAERNLRMGSAEQKAAALAKIAQDYGIPLPSGPPAPGTAPAPTAGQQGRHWDDTVQTLAEKVAAFEQAETSRRQADMAAQQQRVIAEIQSFETAKTEAGQPAHPFFAQVADDVARLITAQKLGGKAPDLKEAYDQAVWANPTTRAQLISEQAATEQRKREAEAKAKAQQARSASRSISGAPRSGSAANGKTGSLREELERNLATSAGRL